MNAKTLDLMEKHYEWHHCQGCQIFFVAYGQNSDKKWPKWLFFKKAMAKITKRLNYGNFHIHRYFKLFGRQYIFCQRNKFLPWNSNFCCKLKITYYNLSLFIL